MLSVLQQVSAMFPRPHPSRQKARLGRARPDFYPLIRDASEKLKYLPLLPIMT